MSPDPLLYNLCNMVDLGNKLQKRNSIWNQIAFFNQRRKSRNPPPEGRPLFLLGSARSAYSSQFFGTILAPERRLGRFQHQESDPDQRWDLGTGQ